MSAAALAGFATGLSLILAIGAQNAFVLRQGLRREHVGAVVAVCALSDAVLIGAGVAGFGALTARFGWLDPLLRYGGAGFLIVYGGIALRSAWIGSSALRAASGQADQPLGRVIAICLALTWGNPHVYLDTLVLMGAVSADWPDKRAFALGGMTASLIFFATLGYGARALAPLFARPAAWRLLDLLVATIMWAIAARLLLGG
ncbi:LysE/ArgO family amino acid transporter [Pseudooceanicola sp.]|uniref:LysE/ArgO family amino acid transporter n=1 Tax=Pseudooceanicola sp. TaxID=1914328 RepID=UPI00261F7A47|nr:LysE/ArgO family amino acid transporter [Pseudooceanicola sp.]MDF1853951.1 LysE/ArgO family amino acid transporter [Pseudooceanicola sp.]